MPVVHVVSVAITKRRENSCDYMSIHVLPEASDLSEKHALKQV